MALNDNFMWFPDSDDDPRGETTDEWFAPKGAFEVLKFDFSVTQTDQKAPTKQEGSDGSKAGKCKFGELSVDKIIDSASPMLARACSKGTAFPSVMLAARKSGARLIYLQLIFRDVAVTGVTWSVEGGEPVQAPTETVVFSFNAMGFQYAQQSAKGKRGRRTNWSWSQIKDEPTLLVEGMSPPPGWLIAEQD